MSTKEDKLKRKVAKELLKLQQDLLSGKKKIKVPWYLVPEEILTDITKSTGLDVTKMKFVCTVDKEGKPNYGVAG